VLLLVMQLLAASRDRRKPSVCPSVRIASVVDWEDGTRVVVSPTLGSTSSGAMPQVRASLRISRIIVIGVVLDVGRTRVWQACLRRNFSYNLFFTARIP
jgi:hypothetical protein